MQDTLNIVILAAGKGTRMYSSLPKVLHQIAGQSMLSRVINTAQSLNPTKIIVVYGHGAELIQAQIKQDVIWAKQEEQLGTGHALKMALPYLDRQGKTLVLYGDVPLISTQTLQKLLALCGDGIALLTETLANPTGFGRIIRQQDQITAIVEEKEATIDQKNIQEINTGIIVIPNQYIDLWLGQLQNNNIQQEFYLTDIVALASQNHIPVYGLSAQHNNEATGVNNKSQLVMLERAYQKQQALNLLEKGVTLLDHNRFDLRGKLTHGQDVTIDVNVIFSGENRLGNNVRIGAHCILNNVTIADDVVIEPYSHLENCIIGQHSKIGPFARLRTGTELAEHTRIGNFVELKNSQIGQNSKVNHLSYVGDASIGQSTNVGAGSITCNYDGANKFKTTIGNQVFIGSGTMLVAPLTIENGATIGAGSVITKTCLSNKLTLTRSPQVTIDSWTRPKKTAKE